MEEPKPMATLYEINEALRDFEFEIDEETGEVTNLDALDEIQLEKNTKIENIALLIKNLMSDAEAYKREKESFARKEQIAKNKADRLRDYLQFNLHGEKFKSDRVQITYRHSEKVEILDPDKIPAEFLRIKQPEPNKVEIKKALKWGAIVEGAVLTEQDTIQIK